METTVKSHYPIGNSFLTYKPDKRFSWTFILAIDCKFLRSDYEIR